MTKEKMENVKVNVVDTQPCSITLHVEIPHPEVTSETERVYQEIQKAARLPGFRQGKAPLDLVKKAYVSEARERVIENLVRQTIFSTLKDQGIEPVDYPKIEELSFDFDKPFTYRMKAERHPEFKVKGFKGLKITKEIRAINETKVNETLESIRERNARLEESKSDTVTDTSFVQIDYDCFSEGAPVAELKGKNQLIDLSSPQSIAGFKEGLAGAKKGDEREIKVTFPAEYPNKKIAGKEVIFKAKVNGIKEKILPALDDELAKDMGLSALDELRSKVKETLESEEKKRQDQETEKQVIEQLLAENPIPVPASLVEEQEKHIIDRMADYFRRQGMPDSAWQKNREQWKDKYHQEAENNVRVSYILNAIAKEENIAVTGDDLSAELDTLKKANPGREADVEKYFNENKDSIASRLKEERLFKFLLDNAKMKEEKK